MDNRKKIINDRISRLKEWRKDDQKIFFDSIRKVLESNFRYKDQKYSEMSMQELLQDPDFSYDFKNSEVDALIYTFTQLADHIIQEFDGFEQKISAESSIVQAPIVIKTAVCHKDDIDKNIYLFKVSSEVPVAEEEYRKKEGYLKTVFVDADYLTIQNMINRKEKFKAVVKIQRIAGERENIREEQIVKTIDVKLRYSERYLSQLRSLHNTFVENKIPWITVNAAYFYKFIDVVAAEEIDGIIVDPDAEAEVEIGGQRLYKRGVDFEGYREYISDDKVLLWNVNVETTGKISWLEKPAGNIVKVEHEIKGLTYGDCDYLVFGVQDNFDRYLRDGALFVDMYTEKLAEISLVKITRSDFEGVLYLPVKSNEKRVSFVQDISNRANRFIPTEGEARRVIDSLQEPDMNLYKITPIAYSPETYEQYKGLEYNQFWDEYIFLPERPLLLFSFKTGGDKKWAYESMYYILAELQLYFYEYRCVGELEFI